MKLGAIKSITIEYDDGEKEIITRKDDYLSLDHFSTKNHFTSMSFGYDPTNFYTYEAIFSWSDNFGGTKQSLQAGKDK
jgi:hypothetical protein